MTDIVWMIKKIRHLIEIFTKPTIIYIDHSAIIGIIRQSSMNTTSIEKLNLRLIRVSEYFQRFRIELRYKPDKVNIVPDALSWLVSRFSDRSENESSILNFVDFFSINVIIVSKVFRDKIIKGYENKLRWIKIMNIMKVNTELRSKNVTKLPY